LFIELLRFIITQLLRNCAIKAPRSALEETHRSPQYQKLQISVSAQVTSIKYLFRTSLAAAVLRYPNLFARPIAATIGLTLKQNAAVPLSIDNQYVTEVLTFFEDIFWMIKHLISVNASAGYS
jgi:hypothetical protein